MKEHSIAVSASLLFHVIIVAIFFQVPFHQYIKPKLMVLDFSLVKGRAVNDAAQLNPAEGGKIVNRETQIGNRKSEIANRRVENEGMTANQVQNIQNMFAAEPSNGLKVVVSDPAGHVVVRGETGPTGVKTDSVSGKNISVGEGPANMHEVSGSMKVIDYGKGDSGVRDLPFITDTINKRFKNSYPYRAHIEGWEGEVLLSFVVLEDGTIHDVKIVKGSGRGILDNHAREILMKTTFNRKLPEPIKIDNWRVTYRLQ
jgi:TonB family protein